MAPRRRARVPHRAEGPSVEPVEPLAEPAPAVDLTEDVPVAGVTQLHFHVYLHAAGPVATGAPVAQEVPSSSAPRTRREVNPQSDDVPSSSAPRTRREVNPQSDDIRYYTVWHIPGHPGIHGIFTGPHPLAWRSIAVFLAEGRLPGSGASLCRQYSEAEAVITYQRERGRYPGLPREPHIHRFQ
jgi:hypothetical protein